MVSLQTAAMWAATASGVVTVGGALATLLLVGSRRARQWLLVQLGVAELRAHVGDLTDRQEDICDRLESELAAAADARQTYAAQILALAYAIENDDEVSLDVAEFARGQAARSEDPARAADFLEGTEFLRGNGPTGDDASD